MINLSDIKTETRIILWLSLPIIANGFLESFYGFISTILVAHLGEAELAVTALVSMFFMTINVVFWGIFSGMAVIIAHYHGAENTRAICGTMRDGLILSLIFSVPVIAVVWFAPYFFQWTGQSDFVVKESTKYLHALAFAIPFDFPAVVLMQLFSGILRPGINFIFTVSYMPFLIFSNYCFMFGKLGLPAFGIAGIGWGTTLSYMVFLPMIGIFAFYHADYKKYITFKKAPSKRYFGEILKIGLPLGSMYSIEIGFFLSLAILMGKFGSSILAAHQIVMQYVWLFASVGFSVGQALSIRMGFHLGRKKHEWIMPLAGIGQGIVFVFYVFIGILYWIFPEYLIRLDFGPGYFIEKSFLAVTVNLFAFAGVFHILDGARCALFSILQGMKQTKFTLFASIIQFWMIALPAGYYFAFVNSNNPRGFWTGLMISALAGTLLLFLRLRVVLYKIRG